MTVQQIQNPGPEVVSWEQLDIKTIKVYLTELVLLDSNYDKDGGGTTAEGIGDNQYLAEETGGSVTASDYFAFMVDPDGDENNAGYAIVAFQICYGIMDSEKIYGFNFSDVITDYVGNLTVDEDDYVDSATEEIETASDTYTKIEAYIDDEDDPKIEEVVAADNKNVYIIYNEDMLLVQLPVQFNKMKLIAEK